MGCTCAVSSIRDLTSFQLHFSTFSNRATYTRIMHRHTDCSCRIISDAQQLGYNIECAILPLGAEGISFQIDPIPNRSHSASPRPIPRPVFNFMTHLSQVTSAHSVLVHPILRATRVLNHTPFYALAVVPRRSPLDQPIDIGPP